MGLSHNLQIVNRPNSISTGLWTRNYCTSRIYFTHSKDRGNEGNDSCWCCQKIFLQLIQLEEDWFVIGYNRNVNKERKKAWNDRHIKYTQFKIGDLVLLYDNKFLKHLGKIRTHWSGPYVVEYVTDGGAIKLQMLDGTPLEKLVNGSWIKTY